MDDRLLKKKEAGDYIILAPEYLDGSKVNVGKSLLRIAVDAAYNACEFATFH